MAKEYSVTKINTTDGARYILLRNGTVSLVERTYYKKKTNAKRRADKLNKNL